MAYIVDKLFQSEELHKEAVYSEFDSQRKKVNRTLLSTEKYVDSGAFEDQESFTAYGDKSSALKRKHEVERLLQEIYSKPYFAHIELQEQESNDSEHFFLSDNEHLEQIVLIDKSRQIIPFKQDLVRPISSALFHCYQSKRGENVSYYVNGEEIIYSTILICDDEVKDRELLNVMQFYPEQEQVSVNADELLEQILKENRSNPALRNIIATLQHQQFRIIETAPNKSFIVQGCAGSGKSQCLFHRLFYLRDTLSEEGWEHVLLLTPTQLFRNYSADLIKRYQLSSINDCSISELYKNILDAYDSRFKNRQYQFELSEEYLPDGYLKTVYDLSTIKRIDEEIEKAINSYVREGCRALGIEMLENFTAQDIESLVEQLRTEIREFDARETSLQEDAEYAEQREKYEKYRKELDGKQKTLDRLTKELNQITEDEILVYKLSEALGEAFEEKRQWVEQRQKRIETAGKTLAHFDRLSGKTDGLDAPAKYMKALYTLRDLTEGETYQADEEYLFFLNDEYCAQAEKELNDILGGATKEQYLAKLSRQKKDRVERIDGQRQSLEQLTEIIKEHEKWLRSRTEGETGAISQKALRRADLERALYFLSRIESSVFDQEVWKALAPQKEKYNIQTLKIEELENDRKRETRILYKSDLLFYIKIYERLHGRTSLPDYTLLCIDEGQDLHWADYNMLKKLFPDAAFNIFGDTDQVLHSECGIRDWVRETGIENLFLLEKNYRNEAGIVDFCNRKFGCSMQYIGRVTDNRNTIEVGNVREIMPILNEDDIAVIVKNRLSYERLCKAIGSWENLEYLDTNSDRISGEKIPCYSIFAAKGLEFPTVLVISDDMTEKQRIVACTRATERLYYYE